MLNHANQPCFSESPRPDLHAAADDLFERHSPYSGPGLRNHCLRLYELAQLVLERDGIEVDLDLLYLAALTHDLGLVVDTIGLEGGTYLERTRELVLGQCEVLELRASERQVLEECLLYNHRLLPVPGTSAVAEAFRQAVWIEHSRGLLRFGLPRDAVRAVFARYPRGDFDRVLVDFARRVLAREPATVVRGIFF
jgi:hypothetical protein